jgi:hypothetical protein
VVAVNRAQRRSEARILSGYEQALTAVATPWPTTVLWRWRYELGAVGALGAVVVALVNGLFWIGALAVAVTALAAALPGIRRRAVARAWCVISEHRVRSGCAQARIHSRQGRLPAVLVTRARPYGEDVLLWCPAGTSAGDFQSARELLTAACWAVDVRTRRHPRRAQLVTVEVVRRPAVEPARQPEEPSGDPLTLRARRHSAQI